MSGPPPQQPSGRKESVKQRYGDYIIGRTFAAGSFGKLKLGTHVPTGTKLAIKVLSRHKITSSKMDLKIRREIRILKLFRHPSICRLYDVIYTSSEILLVMEYVGPELYDYIVKNGKLREDAARYMFQQLICALEYCHHFRVVHRDLKPENVLLGGDLTVKLIDFGLSNLMQDSTFLKTSCGSPNYAAPEVISGRLYAGPEIDVWSCGVVLYALLCGCLPFDEESVPTLFAKIKRGRYTIPAHVSPMARDLIEKILVVDPLTRITIPQIRDHPWFTERLPQHLQYSEATFNRDRQGFHHDVVSKAIQILGMSPQEVRRDLENREGRAWVTCNILADQAEATEIQSIERRVFQQQQQQQQVDPAATQAGSAPAGLQSPGQSGLHILKSLDRETNQGLVLSACPAMTVMLDMNDAVTNKDAYNTGNYMPASVQDSKSSSTLLQNAGSPGHFSLTKGSSVGSQQPAGSLPISNSLRAGSLQNPAALGSLNTQNKVRSGSVAKVDRVYSIEEENFILQNNIGWRIGLMLGHGSAQCMQEIYMILQNLDMEWKSLNPFQLAVRKRGAGAQAAAGGPQPVVVTLHLMRIQEKHDKGYLVDLGACRGSTLEALDLIGKLGTLIKARLG